MSSYSKYPLFYNECFAVYFMLMFEINYKECKSMIKYLLPYLEYEEMKSQSSRCTTLKKNPFKREKMMWQCHLIAMIS